MLIYLSALQKLGAARYRADVAPAGVLNVPARDVIISAPRNATESEIDRLREKELRRSGLVLNEPFVLDAMESGEVKKYLPVKQARDGSISGDSLVSAEQAASLSKHVDRMMHSALSEILDGNIDSRPYYRSDSDNACQFCEYKMICAFDEKAGDKKRFARKMKTAMVWEAIMNPGSEVREPDAEDAYLGTLKEVAP